MAQALASKTCCTEFNLCEIIFRESQSDSRTVSVMLLACAKHEHVLSSSILCLKCLQVSSSVFKCLQVLSSVFKCLQVSLTNPVRFMSSCFRSLPVGLSYTAPHPITLAMGSGASVKPATSVTNRYQIQPVATGTPLRRSSQ